MENLELKRQITKLREDTETQLEAFEVKSCQMKDKSALADTIIRMGIMARTILLLQMSQDRASNGIVGDISLLHDDLQGFFHGNISLETLDEPLTPETATDILNQFVDTSYLAPFGTAL